MIDLRDAYKVIRSYLYSGTIGNCYKDFPVKEAIIRKVYIHYLKRYKSYIEDLRCKKFKNRLCSKGWDERNK